MFRRFGLRSILATAMVLIAVMSTTILGLEAARSARTTLTAAALLNNELLATSLARVYEGFLASHLRMTTDLASQVRDIPPSRRERFAPFLRRALEHYPAFGGIAVVDGNGRVIAAETRGVAGKPLIGADFSDRGWYQRVMATGQPGIDPGVAVVGLGRTPGVLMFAPITDEAARITGVLVPFIDRAAVDALARNARLGDSGHAQAATDLGIPISQPRIEYVDEEEDFSTLPFWSQMAGRSSGQIPSYTTTTEQVRFAGFATVKGVGWKVWVSQDVSEVHAAIAAKYRTLLTWIVASILGAGALVFILSGAISRPIDALRDRARALAEGNLDQTVPEDGPKEIVELARAFNAMASALQHTVGDLRVAQEGLLRSEAEAVQRAAQTERLVEASVALTTELSLERVLVKIAQAACDTLGARYAALGIASTNGTGISKLITAGVDAQTRQAIGPIPACHGVLGLIIRERQTIRLGDIADHPHAAGFPANHPRTRSFLGVPVTVRDRTYGNLYVTEKQGAAEFTATDERLALMLASQAGIAIENAQAFEALHAAQEELLRKERLATLGQIAGGVAHELRNPLAVMKNSIYYLTMILPADARVEKHLRMLEREIGNANHIVADLLDFARVRPPERTATSLTALVGDILDRTTLPGSVTLVLALAPDLPAVHVDPYHVEQVLHNLVTNAVQAMPDGGTLRVETGLAADKVFVAVSDTGVGIPPEVLSKIFQPLFTTKTKGTGLGLALTKNLAESNGGIVSVETTAGLGSCFTVHFGTDPPAAT